MADFLPIGLGRDANGNVSGFQEIKTTDTIPENYLEVNNEDAKWNASGLQGYSVSTTVPTNGYVLTWDSTLNAWKPAAPGGAGNNAGYLNGIEICINVPSAGQFLVYNAATSSWCPSTYVAPAGGGGGIEGPVSITPGNVVVWGGSPTSVDDGGWYFDPAGEGIPDNSILMWDTAGKITDTQILVGDVLTDPDVSIYNANRIQGVSASPTAPTDGQVWVYDNGNSRWTPSTLVLTGGGGSTDATSIRSYSVPAPTVSDDDKVLTWDNSTSAYVWEPRVKSSGTLTANKIIIGDSLGGVSASYATLGTFVDGNVIRYLSGTSAINDAGWGISQSDVTGIVNNRILQWSSVGSVRRIVDSGYARTDAAWNADKIKNYSVNAPVFDTSIPYFDLDTSNIMWEYPANIFVAGSLVGTQGELTGGSITGITPVIMGQTGGGDNQLLAVTPSAASAIPDGAFLVASGGSFVFAYLPAYLLRLFNTNGTSAFPSKIGPAEPLNAEGQLLYYDATNQRWTNTLNLKVDAGSNLSVANVSSTGTIRAVTLSSTNYLNLPSSTIVWASAGYATLAGSATSALNAQQAPNGFNVTGSMLATTVSATNYRNIRPYVSSVDSATTTTVNIGGDFDTYLVNTTTTSVTLYLPDASAWTSKQITISKVEDGGSYRSVTLSGAQLQTATNTIRLYDPTESVTVISNGTSWYSLDYDRAYGVVVVCKNETGTTLAKGTPVKVTGATGDNVLIGPVSALNNHVPEAPEGELSRCIGVVEHAIPTGEFGHVLTKGTLYKFNTNAFNEGDVLYLASSGGFTNVKPTPPYDEVFLGIVTRKQAINGSILIDVANPIHINDIVGINLTSSLLNGDLISYDTTTSTFKNVQTVDVSGQGKFGSVSATNYLNIGNTVAQWNASALQGSPLSANLVPTAGQALMYNGSVWTASAALFAYTYGSGAPSGGSDGDIYLQTDVVALQVPSVSATNLSATNGDLSSIKLTDYSESKSSPTISSSALTLNLNNSQVFTVALNSNISTLTISNVEARANTAQGFTLILTADGTARTITWPGSVKWPSGTGPTLTSTNNKVDILSFLTPDNGTTWYGFVGGQNF